MAAAGEATERFYARHPEAEARYGRRGRAYATHDHAYLVAWITAAVELDTSGALGRNLRWLLDVLVSRGFPRDWFLESLDIVVAVMLERRMLAEPEAAGIVRPVIEGLAAPGVGGQSAPGGRP
jgi:hypothetical protein